MGRKKKLRIADVCRWRRHGTLEWAVVVDYKQDTRKRGRYRVVRVMHPLNGHAYGEAVWTESHYLERADDLDKDPIYPFGRPSVVSNYRANLRWGERGCTCQCCTHEAVPRSLIMLDGTYRWENEGEENDK